VAGLLPALPPSHTGPKPIQNHLTQRNTGHGQECQPSNDKGDSYVVTAVSAEGAAPQSSALCPQGGGSDCGTRSDDQQGQAGSNTAVVQVCVSVCVQ